MQSKQKNQNRSTNARQQTDREVVPEVFKSALVLGPHLLLLLREL